MRTPRFPFVRRPVIRLWLGLAVTSFWSLVPAGADEAPLPAGRVVGTFAGIEVEYSPGREELARAVATRIAARERKVPPELSVADATVPLSAAEMRAHRAQYLAAIAAQLALAKPTAWQEECYDAFLDNYDQHMLTLALMWRGMAESANAWNRVTLWDRAELVRRLEAGEHLAGFSYDPATKQGPSNFNLPEINVNDDRIQEIAARREKLQHDYQFQMSAAAEGGTTYQGAVYSQKRPPPAKPAIATPPPLAAPKLQGFPIVIPEDLASLPAADLLEQLWDKKIKGHLADLANLLKDQPMIDPIIAGLILHETTEIGIVDHYYRGKDRRWFCDGVANYVPWRVVRDLHGPEAARSVYNLDAQLAQYADLREAADLRKWPATENQAEGEQETRLNRARYAFAARAVCLMNERAGENILPRLFAEIGRTKPGKVSMKTVEQAWKKTTGTKLDTILAEAVAAPGVPSPAP